MRITVTAVAGITAGILASWAVRRYGPALLWHVFTTDIRRKA